MRAFFVVPVILFLGLAGLFAWVLLTRDKVELPSMLVGHEVRSFDIPALDLSPDGAADAGRVTDADLKSGHMTVVNFWASWCGPCRIEQASLMGLRHDGLRILGINYKDEPADARRFLNDLGNPFERVGVDRAGRVGIDWGITGVPETFVVNGAGQVIFRVVGPLAPSDIKNLVRIAESKNATD